MLGGPTSLCTVKREARKKKLASESPSQKVERALNTMLIPSASAGEPTSTVLPQSGVHFRDIKLLSNSIEERGGKGEGKRPEFPFNRTLVEVGVKEHLLEGMETMPSKSSEITLSPIPPPRTHSKTIVTHLLGLSQNTSC